jgi:catechol 2,3-dioxygenase-like lactoylglutathione lyase family enzyme
MALTQARVHTTLPVADLQRAKDFYADRLGLTPSSETPGGAFYDCADGTRFVLFPSRGAASGTHTQLGFAVTDIAAEIAELTSRGVVFEDYDLPGFKTEGGIATVGELRSAFLKDSEGNLLGLVQLPPG